MAQGFKPLKSNAAAGSSKGKGKSTAQTKKANQPKKGARVIPPKKLSAQTLAAKRKKQTASVSGTVEEEMIARAAGGGPLKLLKAKPSAEGEKDGGQDGKKK